MPQFPVLTKHCCVTLHNGLTSLHFSFLIYKVQITSHYYQDKGDNVSNTGPLYIDTQKM